MQIPSYPTKTLILLMATSPRLPSILFLILTLFSLQLHARESFFFNKFTHNNNNNPQTTPTNQEKEQDPSFFPQTGNSYGLYGHESGQLPPESTSSTTNTNYKEAYSTGTSLSQQSQDFYKNYYDNNDAYNRNYQPQNSGEFTERGYTDNYDNQQQNSGGGNTRVSDNANNYIPDDSNTRVSDNADNYYSGDGNRKARRSGYNRPEKQGMSDTRYLDDGRFFHDIENENENENENNNKYNYYPNQNEEPKNQRYNNYGRRSYNSKQGAGYDQNQEDQFQENEDEFDP